MKGTPSGKTARKGAAVPASAPHALFKHWRRTIVNAPLTKAAAQALLDIVDFHQRVTRSASCVIANNGVGAGRQRDKQSRVRTSGWTVKCGTVRNPEKGAPPALIPDAVP